MFWFFKLATPSAWNSLFQVHSLLLDLYFSIYLSIHIWVYIFVYIFEYIYLRYIYVSIYLRSIFEYLIRSIFEYHLLSEALPISLICLKCPILNSVLLNFFIFLLGAFPVHIQFNCLSHFWSSSPLSEYKFHEGGDLAWFC